MRQHFEDGGVHDAVGVSGEVPEDLDVRTAKSLVPAHLVCPDQVLDGAARGVLEQTLGVSTS